MIVGGETGGRWLGGFDRSLRAVLLSPLVSQRLTMLASSENSGDLRVLANLIDSGQVTPAIDRSYPLSETPQRSATCAPVKPKARSSSRCELAHRTEPGITNGSMSEHDLSGSDVTSARIRRTALATPFVRQAVGADGPPSSRVPWSVRVLQDAWSVRSASEPWSHSLPTTLPAFELITGCDHPGRALNRSLRYWRSAHDTLRSR